MKKKGLKVCSKPSRPSIRRSTALSGASRRWSASSAWACCSVCGQAFAAPEIPLCHQNDHWPHLPQKDASDGAMTPFQAVCTALAATVGTGNIAGVAGAIAIGGPGAVFWMWCSALLGMCTKFSEVTLAVHFRERNKTASWWAAPCTILKRPRQPVAVPRGALLAVRRADGLRHRQRHPGQHHRHSHRLGPCWSTAAA